MDGSCVDRLSSPCESIRRNWLKYLKLNKYFSSVFIAAVFYISAFVKTYRRNRPSLHECPKAFRLQLFFTAKITDDIFINNAAIAISLTGCWTDQWPKFAKRVNRAGDYSFSARATADLLNHYYNFVLFEGLGEVYAATKMTPVWCHFRAGQADLFGHNVFALSASQSSQRLNLCTPHICDLFS